VDCNGRIDSPYRAAIAGRSEARGGGIVDAMATTNNDAAPAEGKRDAIDSAAAVH